jgi:hypothetical protein
MSDIKCRIIPVKVSYQNFWIMVDVLKIQTIA